MSKRRNFPAPVLSERYAAALGKADPLESQRKAPKRLRKLLKGLSKKELAWKPAPEKWSIKEVLAHLADGEVVLGSRERMIASMDRPQIVGYDQDAFVRELRYDEVSVDTLLHAFTAMRAMNLALLERLPDEAFARTCIHSERGEETLSTMVHMYAAHDLEHEKQIADLRVAYASRDRKGKKKRKAAKAEKAQAQLAL